MYIHSMCIYKYTNVGRISRRRNPTSAAQGATQHQGRPLRKGCRLRATRGACRLRATRGACRLRATRGACRLRAAQGAGRLRAAQGAGRLRAAQGGPVAGNAGRVPVAEGERLADLSDYAAERRDPTYIEYIDPFIGTGSGSPSSWRRGRLPRPARCDGGPADRRRQGSRGRGPSPSRSRYDRYR